MAQDMVLIVGAGRTGVAAARFLSQKGVQAVLTDVKDAEKLAREGFGALEAALLPGVEAVFGRQITASEISACSMALVSPGVPPDSPPMKALESLGIPAVGEIEFTLRHFGGRVLAVTGTNGKTTTTTLAAGLLDACGVRCAACGNIGDAFLNHAGEGADFTAVLEISSFQLETTESLHPACAIITNITPDHLDRHLTMENYIAAKARVFMNMTSDDFLILNWDDPLTRALAPASGPKVLYFTTGPRDANQAGWMEGQTLTVEHGGATVSLVSSGEMKLLGLHNMANALAASLAALALGAPADGVREALKAADPVEHRVEFVREVNGVKYVNDSKGTNPEATMVAVKALEGSPITIILGGYDKHSEFDGLFAEIAPKITSAVVIGQTAPKIIEAAANAGFTGLVEASGFEEAVAEASRLARPGGYVLLSPACASWDMFENYEQRGRVFKELVNKL